MHSYTLLAAAKINLYLEILGDRPDGYHELAMVMQSIDLCDRLEIRLLGTDDIRVYCNHPNVPSDRTNLAYRAAELMQKEFPEAFARYGSVEINIEKNIPIGAGLAGGSSNAASVLIGIDLLWQLGLTQGELQNLAARLGSDIPFCITGGTAIATGRGENLSPLPDLEPLGVVLGKYRDVSISTAWAYSTYRQTFQERYIKDSEGLEASRHRLKSGAMVSAIAHKNPVEIGKALYNDFENVVFPAYPQLAQLKDTFEQAQVLGTLMSGSGSTIFALTESLIQAQQVRDRVRTAIPDPQLDLWVAQLCPTGVRVAAHG